MTIGEMLNDALGGMLVDLEVERRRRITTVLRAAAPIGVTALAATIYFRVTGGSWLSGYFFGPVALVVWAFVVSRQSGRFAGAFKTLVMPELVRALGEELTYYPSSYLGRAEFEECGLFIDPDRYSGCDLVSGYVGDTQLDFSLVHAEEEYTVTETHTDTDSNGHSTTRTETRTEYRDIFRGLLFSADCNKEFCGVTFVTAGGSGFFDRRKRTFVALEDPEFSKAFTVHASDQVEARYLLTPSLMTRIMELRGRVGNSLQLSFVGERVYVAFPLRLDTFVPSFWKRIDDLDAIAGYYWTLSLVVGIVEDLNLNLRIWSKRLGVEDAA